ncbi:BlaI/MecI/CopY family transcriptional regulator [Actinomadura sp. DC4]|uniref:BlaI/MecI/CopY family transcriptional regulator n=1 Tax=Actinomadura sp. DC4 TaxID=3055069 RepID=UPI0025AF708D|nr:BlaI/MecI/CopY family transcriptional regulator [Actinomadura sp. DC4]MDN3352138.1 BlaI/MecI/CopY family transcriptional regulator [Actinomadura sp. DC4]
MAGVRRGAGQLEAEVLGALWSTDRPLTPSEVQARIGGELAYNTVHTILKRLWDKGLVIRDADGRRGAYRPARDATEQAAQTMHEVLRREPDRAAVLERFVTALAPDDEQMLRKLLDAS